jgi:hypothetical protein
MPAPDSPNLFGVFDLPPAAEPKAKRAATPAGPAPAGPFASVAIEQSIDRTLDYAIPAGLLPGVGSGSG